MKSNNKYPILINCINSKYFFIGFILPSFLLGAFLYLRYPYNLFADITEHLSFFVKTYFGTRGQLSQIEFGLNKIGALLILMSFILPFSIYIFKWILNNLPEENIVYKEKIFNLKLNKTDWVIITILFVTSAILRIIPIGQSFWQPEMDSYRCFMEQGYIGTFFPKSAAGPHPLMQLIGITFTKIFGLSDFNLRFPCYLISVLSIPLLYIVSLKLTSNRLIAILAGSFLAIHSYHIFLSFQMRSYGIMVFFTIISYYLSNKLYNNPTRKNTYKLTAINVLLIYSQMYGGLFVIAQFISVIGLSIINNVKKNSILSISQNIFLEFYYSFVLTVLLSCLLYFTHIPVTAMSLFNLEYSHDLPFIDYVIRAFRLQYHLVSFVKSPLLIYSSFGVLGCVLLLYSSNLKKDFTKWNLFFSFIFTIAMSMILKSGQGFFPRYVVCAIPLLIIILATVISEWWQINELPKRIVAFGIGGISLFISIAGFTNSYRTICPLKEALEYIDSIENTNLYTIGGDKNDHHCNIWYKKNAILLNSQEDIIKEINKNKKIYIVLSNTKQNINRIETDRYQAFEYIEKEFQLIKTFNGHFPIYIWSKI